MLRRALARIAQHRRLVRCATTGGGMHRRRRHRRHQGLTIIGGDDDDDDDDDVAARRTRRERAHVDAFQAAPSVEAAIRALDANVDEGSAWSIFERVIHSPRLTPTPPFFASMMRFCCRRMPRKAPVVMSTAGALGLAGDNDDLFATFLSACARASPAL
ncbi:hypothetical protein PBRA_008984, partial [Plasmodiophora brassicae]